MSVWPWKHISTKGEFGVTTQSVWVDIDSFTLTDTVVGSQFEQQSEDEEKWN